MFTRSGRHEPQYITPYRDFTKMIFPIIVSLSQQPCASWEPTRARTVNLWPEKHHNM